MKNYTFFLLIVCVFISSRLQGQDPHFSLFFNNVSFYNPAHIGHFDGKQRAQLANRKQWASLNSPYTTAYGGFEHKTQMFGLGGWVIQDKAGDNGLNYLNAMAGISVQLGQGPGRLRLGFQGGILQKSFNPQGFSYGSQYTSENGYDSSLPSGENMLISRVSVATLRLGALYIYEPLEAGKLEKMEAGLTLSHANQPELVFFDLGVHHPRRTQFQAAMWLRVQERLRFHPAVIGMKQGKAGAWLISSGLEYELDQEVFMEAGLGYRTGDAVYPYLNFTFNHFQLGFAYDLNISTLSAATQGRGGAEVSLTYLIGVEDKPLSNYEKRKTEIGRNKKEKEPVLAENLTKSLPDDRDGDGIIDTQDACPDLPGILAYRGCPDQDYDGLPDHMDRCPTLAGPRERAGCPLSDIDADGDEVPDKVDECPLIPGLPEWNGCPEIWVEKTDKKVQTDCGCKELEAPVDLTQAFGPYEFDTDKAIIRAEYLQELSLLAREMTKNPQKQLLIEGHTDAEGDAQYNLALGKARSHAIAFFLMQRGISPSRITEVSYGELVPKSMNDSASGKARNRRVELFLYGK
jgi:type IX secretion system PorP/SprF family membrane protein